MKVLYGAALGVDASGKLGGHVASKNRGGAYWRTKVTPLNPQTTTQTDVRNTFTANSQAWRGLTATEQAAWNSAVSQFQKTDVFGSLKSPSGINLYQRLNTNIVTGGGTVISLPPAPGAAPVLTAVSVTSTAGTPTVSVIYAPSPVPASTAYVIEATPMLSPGISFVKNRFRIIHVLAATAATPFNALTAYEAKFGAPVAGQKLFIRVWAVNLDTGIKSLPLVNYCIVGA